MTLSRRHFTALTLAAPVAWALGGPALALARDPLVIATGAGTGEVPPMTRGAYEQAIRDGADVIAGHVFPTKDGALVIRPDHELSQSTDVAGRPDYADRRQTRFVEGKPASGWFVEDFTLGELKTLTCGAAGKRRAAQAPDPARMILTVEDLIGLARAGSVKTARVVGVQLGVSRGADFAALDLAVEPRVAGAIRAAGYNARAAALFVSSAERDMLKTLGDLVRSRRILRLGPPDPSGEPPDPARLRPYAEVLAADVSRLLDLTSAKATPPTRLIADAHAAGLAVHAWTSLEGFRPPPFRPGDARRVTAALFAAGCEGVMGDSAGLIARARGDASLGERG